MIKLSIAKNCTFPLTVHVHTRRKSREAYMSGRHNSEFRTDLFLTTGALLKSAGLLPSASVVAGKGSFVPLSISHLSLPGVIQLILERGCEGNTEQAQAGCLGHRSWLEVVEKTLIFRHSMPKKDPKALLEGSS